MKYGIVGSRDRIDKQSVIDFVNTLTSADTVITGGCVGPDLWAEHAANNADIPTIVFLPKLPAKGSPRYEFTKAFYARNKLIAENCDTLVAFVSKERKGGTENTIKQAQRLGRKIIIIAFTCV